MNLRLCVEWYTLDGDTEETLVWARSRAHAINLFMSSESYQRVDTDSGWGLANIPRRVGCVP